MENVSGNRTVLILGAEGMLGNAIFSYLKSRGVYVVGTSRKKELTTYEFFEAEKFQEKTLNEWIKKFNPYYILNCIGYIRPLDRSLYELNKLLAINALFPQKLVVACRMHRLRLIQFSTDCVFSGKAGPYDDTALPDETGAYGLSKFLGEIRDLPSITLRTSIIGKELETQRNLLDWFLSCSDAEIQGYTEVWWNGVTTITIAKIVERILNNRMDFSQPIIQLASETINKYQLLNIFRDVYGKKTNIIPFAGITSNKTLIPSVIQKKYFQDLIPPLRNQIIELKEFYQ